MQQMLTRDNTWKTWPLRISIFYSVTWPPICRTKVNFKVHWSSRGHYKYIINIAKLCHLLQMADCSIFTLFSSAAAAATSPLILSP